MKKKIILFVLFSMIFTACTGINSDLIKAAGGGHTETVQALLAKGADVKCER